jgi:hypothetical protein
VRHRPETTLLYQIVHEYWPEFQAELASQDQYLPAYVIQEFEAYLKCGRLEHGFLVVSLEGFSGIQFLPGHVVGNWKVAVVVLCIVSQNDDVFR